MRLTVGTTALPNLANRGTQAGKPLPLSQILAPPTTDPDSGFTSVSVGAQETGSGSGAMPWGGDAGGDEVDELPLGAWAALR